MEVHTLHTQTHTCTHIHTRTHTCLGWSALDWGTHTTHTYTHMHTHTHTCTHICRMKCTWLRYTHYIPIYPYRCKTMELTISQSGTKLLLACLLYTRLRRVCRTKLLLACLLYRRAYCIGVLTVYSTPEARLRICFMCTHTHTYTHAHTQQHVRYTQHACTCARTHAAHARVQGGCTRAGRFLPNSH